MADPSVIEFLAGSFESILTALSSGIISLSNLELWAGFTMTVALVIAVLDILLIWGTGSVLIPWGVLMLAGMLLGLRFAGFIGRLGIPFLQMHDFR